MNNTTPIFEIEGKPRRKGLKKLRSYVALYSDRIEIELDGEYAVNGEKPVFTSEGTRLYLWLTPGEHTLGLTYRWDKLSLFGKLTPYENANRTVQGKNAEKRVVMEANGEYTLFYDIEGETYCLTAEDDGERTKHGKGM